MIGYLLIQSPLWDSLPNGKRNVRILFLTLTLYILLHSMSFRYRDSNFLFDTFYGYFYWIFLADVFVCACNYKNYYGRSIINELAIHEKDKYDEPTHTYVPDKIIIKDTNDTSTKTDDNHSPKNPEKNDSLSSDKKNIWIR
jgi:hypothetical protein